MKTSSSYFPLKVADLITQNKLPGLISVIILILPVIATTGQFISASYFNESTPILLLYWPGKDFTLSVTLVVWLFMGLVFLSYLSGIIFMFYKRTLVKVILLTIFAFICAGLLRSLLTTLFGWQESTLPDVSGKANSVLLAQWHNPVWEELVFRGIPLLVLLVVEKYITRGRTSAGVLIYLIAPSLISGLYHIPGHGIIRFFDTLFLGIFFGWIGLRYTFFAPVVMHYIADAMIVFNLDKIPSIQPSEITWLIQYGKTIGSFFWLLTMLLIFSIPVMFIFKWMKQKMVT